MTAAPGLGDFAAADIAKEASDSDGAEGSQQRAAGPVSREGARQLIETKRIHVPASSFESFSERSRLEASATGAPAANRIRQIAHDPFTRQAPRCVFAIYPN